MLSSHSIERCGRREHRGFSILETTVALAIFGLLVALSVPRFQGYLADRSLQNAAHLIQADLRLAQQAAQSRAGSGPRVEMCFRADGYDIYPVNFVGDPLLRSGAEAGATFKAANRGSEYPSGIAVVAEASAVDPCLLDAARRAIVFSSSGEPSSFDDATSKNITLGLRGRTYRVTIAPVTGSVTVGR